MQLTDGAVGLTNAGVDASQASWPLQSGSGADFPDPALGQYFAKIFDKTLYSSPEEERAATGTVEESRITAKAGDTLTVVRGPDAKAHNVAGHAYEVAVCDSARNLMCVHVYDVIAFGADPTGATDSSTAVSAALVASAATGHPVYFPTGTYEVNSITLTAAKKYFLIGDGPGLSIIIHKDSATGPMFVDPATTNISSFRAVQLTFDGNRTGLGSRTIEMIRLEVDTFQFIHCEFKSSVKAALRINELGIRGEVAHCEFHDMAVHSNVATEDSGAFLMNKSVASDAVLWLHHNLVRATAPATAGENPYGFLINCSDAVPQSCLIESNRFVNIGQELQGDSNACVHLYQNCDSSIIRHNVFNRIAAEAIRVQKSSNVLVHQNIVDDESTLIAAATVSVISFAGRATTADDGKGIISENIIRDCPSFDLAIKVAFDTLKTFTDLDVLRNQIDGTKRGVLLDYVDGSINIIGNKVRGLTTTTTTQHAFQLTNIEQNAFVIFEGNFVDDINVRVLDIDHDGTNTVVVRASDNIINDAGTSLSAGNALFDFDDFTVLIFEGNEFTNLPAGIVELEQTNITTTRAGGASPAVEVTLANDSFAILSGVNFYILRPETGTNDTVTTITGGVDGMEITLKIFQDSDQIFVTHTSAATADAIKLVGDTNFTMGHRADMVRLKYFADVGQWISIVEHDAGT